MQRFFIESYILVYGNDMVMTDDSTIIIDARGVTKYYGTVPAMDNLSIQVHEGEIYGLFGPNGAGKTTTIRVLTGLTQPDKGEVYVCGINVVQHPTLVRGYVAVLFDVPLLYDNMSCRKYLLFYGRMAGISKYSLQSELLNVAETMGIQKLLEKRIGTLSAGEKQRVELARVFMSNAKLLFLDEPFSNIDVELRKSIRTHLRYWLQEGRSIFFTSHNLIESEYLVDRFAFINRGKIYAVGTARDLKHRYLMPWVFVETPMPDSAYNALMGTNGIQALSKTKGGLNVLVASRDDIKTIPRVLLQHNINFYELRSIGTMEDVFDKIMV